ncbi:MAG TPA: lamin tail domain-containing protein, partial [Candidatus Binatia bacterium]|nr:lamin tail domain-containing protein [Candidatus Binatia bacterium]
TNTALAIGITKDSNAGIPLDQSGDAVVLIAGLEYNPSSGNQEQEYVCITNPQPYAVDISDWELSGGIRFKFKKGTVIPTNSVLYVSPNLVAFRSRTVSPRGGQALFVVGKYEGQLSARGETLFLHDQWGRLVHTNSYPGTPSAAQQFLRVTEIMYSPAPPPSGPYSREDFEYIELKNTGPSVLSLLNVRFLDGIIFNFTGSAVTALNSGQSVVVVRNTNAFTARYGAGLNVAGQFLGALDNGGERLRLVDALGEEILDFSYNNSWYPITDGYGFSLVIREETAPFYTWGDKLSWRPSGQLNGSPGTGNGTPPAIAPIRINEVLAHTDLPQRDAIELYNPTASQVDISGWFISDDLTNITKFRIPNGTTIAAGGYVVFDESQFNPTPGTPPSFAFSSKGDEVVLASADLAGNLTGYLDIQDFGASETGVSFGPHVTSTGEEHFVARDHLTLGAANADPKLGPVIISEIMYRPPDVGGEDNSLDEFIELQNSTGGTVNLYDPAFPTNTWRLDKGIDFSFPPGVSMAASTRLLVVNFDPTNTTQLAAFRARYGVSPSVPVYGPYEGKLDNSGERIELQKPDAPDTNGVPYILVERVDYKDSAPWPAAADGAGASLQRTPAGPGLASMYANDPAHWLAAVPTAGAGYTGGAAPTVTTQPVSQNVVATTDATLSVTASGSPPLYYQWRHNGANIPGATNSSYTIDNARPPDRGDYEVLVFNTTGSTLSSNAVIEILIPARISQHPASIVFNRGSTNSATWGYTFSNFTFSVQALSSSPLAYQWRFNGTNIANGPNYFGVTGATLIVSNATLAHAGTYSVLITDAVGTIESAPATLTINIPVFIVQHPQSVTAVGGDTVYFMVSPAGTAPFGYRWRRGGINMFPQYQGGFSPFPFISIAVTNVPSIQTNRFDVIVNNPGNPTPGVPSQNAFLFVLPDADGDGLPDSYETANGFNPADPADGRIDSDGDGMKNFQEYTAGTDPNDPASYLKVDTITLGTGANVTFIARSNKTYSVQYRDNLAGAGWQRLTNLNATATNRTETVVDLSGTTNRFYRLVVPNQP